MLRLHDTATGSVSELDLRQPGAVSLYVCGPTVYDVPHLGHGRSVLVYDILRRYLEWAGLAVTHVSNITDIDDKIIARAAEEGTDTATVARRYEDAWWDAVDALDVLRPTHAPRATEFVGGMIELIERLVGIDMAYVADNGVWFAASELDGYGLLARQSLESLQAGARVDVDTSKRSPFDFALWKFSRPDEPSWSAPWGAGRPGWHTECVVMSLDLLGDGFDIHSGGMDLQFPHHENERAQAVALGNRFARTWMHHAFVEVGGEKMSKSLGNYTSLTDLIARDDPRALRLLVLRAHYRSPMEVSRDAIVDATLALGRLDALARRRASMAVPTSGSGSPPAFDAPSVERFASLMDDDLDTPGATALIFDLIRRANTAADAGDDAGGALLADTAIHLAGSLGVAVRAGTGDLPDDVAALVAARTTARASKNWAESDRLRSEIGALGFTVEDGPEGTQSVRRNP